MGLFSLILAMVAMLITLIAFIPLLGWLNWLFIPFSVATLIVNMIFYYINLGLRQAAKAGMIISFVAIVIGILRLSLFWGIF